MAFPYFTRDHDKGKSRDPWRFRWHVCHDIRFQVRKVPHNPSLGQRRQLIQGSVVYCGG